jgi:ribosome biogenesis GTPase
VNVVESGIFECKAKGAFRKDGIKPLVGDDAVIEVLDEKEMTGNITEILPRKNELIRPAVANIDQALVVFAVKTETALQSVRSFSCHDGTKRDTCRIMF